MALNRYMHPKNIYRKKQPNFKNLALKYEGFRSHTSQDEAGKIRLDFKDARALKALSWVLLKDDFELDVEMPLDRLIPTIPLRLNYLHWLADIVGKKKNVHGIDIGCGASCVYPLLGTKMNKWSFLATEGDEMNFEFAQRNIQKNEMVEKIRLVKVEADRRIFQGLEEGKKYEFTMCNPPFFGSNLEAYAMTKTRNPEGRPEPSSVCTASEAESITPGGEVEFTKRMIDESLELNDRVRVFTTMLGKKSSVGLLKEDLRQKGIKNFGSYEFCQGRTMRWGLGWSFDEKVVFPKSPFHQSKVPEKGPLTHFIDENVKCAKYEIQPLGEWLKKLLEEIKVEHSVIMDCEAMWCATVHARQNTWANQRRKRRAEKRAENPAKRHSPSAELDLNSNPKSIGNAPSEATDLKRVVNSGDITDGCTLTERNVISPATKTVYPDENEHCDLAESSSSNVENLETADTNDSGIADVSKSESQDKLSSTVENHDMMKSSEIAKSEQTVCEAKVGDKKCSKKGKSPKQPPPLFSAWFTFKFDEKEKIFLEVRMIEGHDKEAMHQVMQLIKNRLKL